MAAAAPFSDPSAALDFVRAGSARLTLRSCATGTRYTFWVRRNKADEGTARPSYYVRLLKGPNNTEDYTYLGMIRGDQFFVTKNTRHLQNASYTKAFRYAYGHLAQRNAIPPNLEIWHESKCGRCGRALTVPESIASGIGPECSKRRG